MSNPNSYAKPVTVPQTVDEWALSLPEEDRKRLTAILVYTPFARDFLIQAWSMGYRQAVADHDASGCPRIFMDGEDHA